MTIKITDLAELLAGLYASNGEETPLECNWCSSGDYEFTDDANDGNSVATAKRIARHYSTRHKGRISIERPPDLPAPPPSTPEAIEAFLNS